MPPREAKINPVEEYVWISKAIDLEVFKTRSHPIMYRLAQEWGVKVTIAGSPGLSIDDEPYIKAIYDAIERKVAGILVQGWGLPAEVDAINKAVDCGIPVITVDSDVPSSNRLAHVGTDWFRMGSAMADQLAGLIANKGKVLVIGNVSLANLQAGYRGVYERMKAYPDIEVFGPENDSLVGSTREITTSWLKAHPDINGIVGLGSLTGPRIADVVEEMELAGQVKVVCVDAEAAHIEGINKGTIQVAFSQRRECFTYQAFQILYAYNHGSAATGYQPGPANISGSIDTGFTIVTKWNADSFRDEFSLDETIDRIKLTRRLALMSTAVESSDRSILVVDSERKIVYANPTAVHVSGLTEGQIIGFPIKHIFDLTEEDISSIEQCAATRTAITFEANAHQASGHRVPVQFSVSPLRNDSIYDGLVIFATDISEQKRGEAALRQSEARYRALIESQVDLISRYQPDTTLTFVNDAYCRFYDKTREELLGQSYLTMVAPEFHDVTLKEAESIVKDPRPISGEYLNYSADGKEHWIQWVIQGVTNENGQVIEIQAIGHDITRLKQTEESLRINEARYRSIVETAQEGIWLIDHQAITTYVNPKMAEILGYSFDEMVGRSLFDFMDESTRSKAQINLDLRSQGITEEHEFCFNHKDGREVWTSLATNAIMDEQGQFVAALAMVTDITERKQSDDTLREQQQFLQFVLDNIPSRVFWKDVEGRFLGCNQLFAEDMGLQSPAELIGKTEWFAKTSYTEMYYKDDREVMENGLPRLNYEEPFMSRDGKLTWLQTSKVPLKDSSGKLIGILGTYNDISQRKAMEQALLLTQFSVDHASIGIMRTGTQAEILEANHYFCELLGYTKQELCTKHIYDIDPDFPFERWRENRSLIKQRGTHIFETRHRRKDGSILPVEITSSFVAFQGDEFIVSFVRDITEQKKTLEALRMTSFAVENASDAVYWIDPNAIFVEVNPAACKMLGYSRDELVGMKVNAIEAAQTLDEIRETLGRVSAGETLRFETQHKMKTGQIIPVEIIVNSISHEGKELGCAFVWDITERKRTLEALMFKSFVVENSPDAVYWIDSNLRFTDVNEAACKMLGYSRDALLTMSTKDVNAERSLDQLNEIWNQTQKYGSLTFETLHRTKSGRIFPVEALISHITYEGKQLNCAFVRDISERKQVENELRNREALLNEAQQFSHVGSWDMDIPSGRVRWTDESFRLFGYQPKEIEPTFYTFLSRIHPDDRPMIHAQLEEIRTLKVFNPITYRVLLPDNSIRWIQNSGTVLLDEQGNAVRLLGMQQDVTERKQAEEALKRSENRFRVLVENSPDYIIFLDAQFKIQYINRVAEGNVIDWFIGKNVIDFAMSQFAGQSFDTFERVLKTGNLEQFEVAARTMQGESVWYATRVVPIYEDGQDVNLMLVTSDITDRKRAENELRSSEERLRQVVRAGNIGIFDHDHHDNSIYWSPELRTIYGWSLDETLPFTAGRDAVYPDDAVEISKAVANAWDPKGNGGYDVEYRIVRRDSQVRWISTRSLTFFEGEGETRHPVRTIGAIADITERKRIEEALRASEQYAREFQEKLKALHTISIELTGAESIETLCSKAIELGSSKLSYGRLGMGVFADKEKRLITVYGINELGALRILPESQLAEDDFAVHSVLTAPSDSYVNENADLYDDYHKPIGHGWNVVTGLWSNDNSIGWLAADNLFNHKPLLPYQVELLNLFGLVLGHLIVRKRSEAEIHKLNEELEQRVAVRTQELQEANNEIKNFAYIVSHDLRAPLVNLKGFSAELDASLKLVRDGCSELLPMLTASKREAITRALQQDIPEALYYIESSVSTMDTFTKAILKLSRLGRLQLDIVKVDVREIVEKKLGALGYDINQKNIKVKVGNLPFIDADAVSMEQIIGNILANAVAYMVPNRPGEIEITAWSNPNETIFRIRDNGRGIAKDDMEKVFAPFRRAGKQDVPGEGMGLAYVQTLVRRHAGRIWCESTQDVGTTFCFTISKRLSKETPHLD